MTPRTLSHRIHPAGPLLAVAIGCAGWASMVIGVPPGKVALAAHNLGLALTVAFGVLAATWWRQAAVVANRVPDLDPALPDTADRAAAMVHDSNMLNACAATATALGLIASGFISVPWGGTASWASLGAFLLVLAILGDDFHQAVAISVREHLRARSLIAIGLIIGALVIFASNRTSQ